jgi:hypothetical protein
MRRLLAVSLALLALLPTASMAVAADNGPGEPRIIEIDAGPIEFLQGGEVVTDIPVTPGETVVFRVNNVAGVKHNFYIGTDEELRVQSGTTDVGIADWIRRPDRVQELTWTVPDDISGLKFGCTIIGHYDASQGTFSLAGETGAEAASGDTAGSVGADEIAVEACDPADPNVSSCWSEALATVTEAFEEHYTTLLQVQAAGVKTDLDTESVNLAFAQWADDLVVAVQAIGLAAAFPEEMEAFVSTHAAYAQYNRENADVGLRERDELEALGYLLDRQKARIALQQAVAAVG